jgi:hypothetical protein
MPHCSKLLLPTILLCCFQAFSHALEVEPELIGWLGERLQQQVGKRGNNGTKVPLCASVCFLPRRRFLALCTYCLVISSSRKYAHITFYIPIVASKTVGIPVAQAALDGSPFIETISWSPRAFVYHNFLTHAECNHLVNKGEKKVRHDK